MPQWIPQYCILHDLSSRPTIFKGPVNSVSNGHRVLFLRGQAFVARVDHVLPLKPRKRMYGVLFPLFHTSPWRCASAMGLVYVPMRRISPLFTWGTDDSCYIFPSPRAWYLPHFIVEAVRQVTFVALTLHAAQHHGGRVATEKICLYGVIGIAQSQLAADHHSFEYTPAVPAHQTPSYNSSNRVKALWSRKAFTEPSTVIINSNSFGTGTVFEMHLLSVQ